MSVPDVKVVNEIPTSMQKLVRLVVRGFYGVECGVLIDLLIQNVCMREDDLKRFLRFDTKQLRQNLIMLKTSKLIKERQKLEVKERQKQEVRSDTNRPTRFNCYFINYRAFLSILKYKLDHMRRKLESEEKTSIYRSTFKCTKCLKPYTDLDINMLWNGQEMQCTYCLGVVEEDASSLPSSNSRSSLAKFNEQMAPIFHLMRELDGIQLAAHLLEPEPRNLDSKSDKSGKTKSIDQNQGHRGSGRNLKADQDVYKSTFTVTIEGKNDDVRKTDGVGLRQQKQTPIWLQQQHGGSSLTEEEEAASSLRGQVDAASNFTTKSTTTAHTTNRHDIAHVLLAHESTSRKLEHSFASIDTSLKSDQPNSLLPKLEPKSEFINVGSEVDEPKSIETQEDEDDDEEELEVKVQGQIYSLAVVMERPDLVALMTSEEKEEYVRISQAAFENMYGDY